MYAFFSVLVILLFDKAAHGAEHIKQTLTGHLIWAGWEETVKVFLIYSVVSVMYFFFHKSLWRSSIGENTHWKWNLLFYVLFSLVIASSVSIAGVLLVFSFLIVPAFLSHFLFRKFSPSFVFWLGTGTVFELRRLKRILYFESAHKSFYYFSIHISSNQLHNMPLHKEISF